MPRDNPVKEDSIINLLQNAEIELNTCPKLADTVVSFNTGFGENQDLHYEDSCKKLTLKVPLYQENYLSEFVTEEEKAAARHALGLYNKEDVVMMSLLTAEDYLPSSQDWSNATIKQLRKGDRFFTPVTSTTAVYDSSGTTLDTLLKNLQSSITKQQKELATLIQPTTESTITSIGDIKVFLEGFNNGDNLHEILDDMDQKMLRFEKTGQI